VEVAVRSFFGGFVAIGMVANPGGPPGKLHQHCLEIG